MAFRNQPLSNRGSRPATLFFFSIFFLLGSVFFYFFFIRPGMRATEARHWVETPCRIVSSRVGEHSGQHGSTYSVDIVFSYMVDGRGFTSAHYGFMGGSSSGYAGKAAIVRRYPPGMRTVCYVNPSNPADAVIERGFTKEMLFGLIPAVFVLIGLVGMIATRKRQWTADGAARWKPSIMRHAVDFAGASAAPVEMKPAVARLTKLGFVCLFMLVWNSILGVFVFHAAEEWRTGRGEWLLSLFLVPFVLVGSGAVVAVVWMFMALFNPRVHLRLAPGVLRPGTDFTVEWNIPGASSRLSQLRILLECREEADFQSGDESSTATQVCYRAELVNAQNRAELEAGTAKSGVPSGVMHSLDTGRNRIKWILKVAGKVPRWPGIKDEYPVVMLPERWKEGA